jgi:hypothetical protein
MWSLPYDPSESTNTGKEREGGSSSRLAETRNAVATRAESLLRWLKTDPAILRHDPEIEEGVKDQYAKWRESEVDKLVGGIDGAEWEARIDTALRDTADGQALAQLEETLVPSEMPKDAFWLRFFFRTYQIRLEEENRKALINGSTENEDDFTWEDEEEELSPSTGNVVQATANTSTSSLGDKTVKESLAPPSMGLSTSDTISPRVSSEDSFDLISSANGSVVGDSEKLPKRKDNDDEGDSDWE